MKIILKIIIFLVTVLNTNIVEAKIIVFNGVVFVTKNCVINIERKKELKQISEIGLDLIRTWNSDFFDLINYWSLSSEVEEDNLFMSRPKIGLQ